MKIYISFTLAILVLCMSCTPQDNEGSRKGAKAVKKLHPVLDKILDHHGGLAKWQKMKSMSFELPRESQNEIQKIDLQSRKEVISGANYITGRDDIGVWLAADSTYNGNALFYHNLMFYFIAMPYVLADDGVNYAVADPLVFDGKSYPGLKISYEDSIGLSPQDEYYVHYNPETFQMEWLGYTVTYYSKKKTTDLHWIKYSEWQDKNGLLIPVSLDWYKYENGLPTEFRNKVKLENVSVSSDPFDSNIFEKPESAEYLN